jgi:hypothetical protein
MFIELASAINSSESVMQPALIFILTWYNFSQVVCEFQIILLQLQRKNFIKGLYTPFDHWALFLLTAVYRGLFCKHR